jgi:predicted transcriptional regulator
MGSELIPVAVEIDADVQERMRRLADSRHSTPHRLMREAISQYVEREEHREKFLREGGEAWREFHETGLHVTGAEVVSWLETWGTETEQAAPACRK